MRITADVIEEEQCANCETEKSKYASKIKLGGCHMYTLPHKESEKVCAKRGSKLKLVVKDASRAKVGKQCHFMLNKMVRKFREFDLGEIALSSSSAMRVSSAIKEFLSSKTSEEMEEKASSSKTEELDSEKIPESLVSYLDKMKEEITKDVTKKVLQQVASTLSSASCKLPSDRKVSVEKVKENSSVQTIHKGIYCDHCDNLIHGVRYKCGNCADFDLCEKCESLSNVHDRTHIFLKIRYPMPQQAKPRRRRKKMVVKHILQELQTPNTEPLTQAEPADIELSEGVMEARFVRDETIPDGTVLYPGMKFVKCWRICNSGTKQWTSQTSLKYCWGSKDLVPLAYEVEVPHLKPGEEGIIAVHFIAPNDCGKYSSHWEFYHKIHPFGHHLWCNIVVQADQGIKTSLLCSDKEEQRQEVTQIAEVLTAVQEEHERGKLGARKTAVTSYTATPNNTPFDLTPPKSPEPSNVETMAKEIPFIPDKVNLIPNSKDKKQEKINNSGSENEDKVSIFSLSSGESDTEYVMIPMPKCFSLNEPFMPSHLYPDEVSPCSSLGCLELDANHSTSDDHIKSQVQPTTQQSQVQSETVSQETGAPEEAENQNVQATIQLERNLHKEDCDKNKTSLNISDCTSSEVSVIESGQNSPANDSPLHSIEPLVCSLGTPEQESGIPKNSSECQSSGTYPKLPLSNAASAPTPAPKEEERTIQVLPEGLVTGALSAAATVYNTARAVISSIQVKNDQAGHNEESQNAMDQPPPPPPPFPMSQLLEMGFCNRSQNEQLLRKHNGDVALVVAELVNMNDNDWYASRHAASNFD